MTYRARIGQWRRRFRVRSILAPAVAGVSGGATFRSGCGMSAAGRARINRGIASELRSLGVDIGPELAAVIGPSDLVAAETAEHRVVSVDDRCIVIPTGPGTQQVERDDSRFVGPPQPRSEALTLARLLLGFRELPNDVGPWCVARPGGRRTVAVEPVTVGGLS